MDFLPDVIGGDEESDENIVVEVVKPTLNEDDVFDDDSRDKLKMKPVKDEPILPETDDVGGLDVEDPEPPVQIKKTEPVKKPRKKRVMSEEQKLKLAEARKKALAVRQAKAKKKKEINMLKEAKENQDLDDLRKSVRVQPKPKPVEPVEPKPVELTKPTKPNKEYLYTQEDMDNITFKAISNYDEIRKSRKKEKQKIKEENSIKERERNKLMKLVSSKPKYDGEQEFWGNCF